MIKTTLIILCSCLKLAYGQTIPHYEFKNDTLFFYENMGRVLDGVLGEVKIMNGECYIDSIKRNISLCQQKLEYIETLRNKTSLYPCKIYIENKLREQGRFFFTRRIGDYIQYYPNGIIKMEGQFNDDGYKIGKWIYYNNKGEISKRRFYKKGRWYREVHLLIQ